MTLEDLEIRILQLESKVNDGKQISYETAREQARAISQGEIKEQHIGKKSKEVLAQEWKSLLNELSPNTMTDDESKEWYEKNLEIVREVMSHKDTKWILNQVREFRDILEKIDEVKRIL